MKVGDLVTLSSYAKQSASLCRWNNRIFNKPDLVGIVVRIEENPYKRSYTSKNESIFYFINWIQKNGPASRWGSARYHRKDGYFLRNDLKFVKKR